MARSVDACVGAAIATGAASSLSMNEIGTLQKIDLLRQSLEELNSFMEQLAKQTPVEVTIDPRRAIEGLKLRDLAQALSSVSDSGSRPPQDLIQKGGDAFFF